MVLEYWQKAIFDADAADWITVAAYFITALLCLRASDWAKLRGALREARFWWFSSILLVLLGINELLDLQALLTAVGKAHAQAYGWYEDRRQVQYVFVLALGAAGIITGIAILWLTQRMAKPVQVALVGFLFIAVFILLRAISIHHVDELLGSGFQRFNWGSVQEMIGIAIVAVAALRYRRKPTKGYL